MALFDRRPDDTDRLHDYLDDLAMGVLAPRSAIDPGLAKTVSRVHQAGSGPAASPSLKAEIWEEIMQTTVVSNTGSLAAPLPPASAPVHHRNTAASALPAPRPIRFPAPRWIAAAIALLALVGGALYAAIQPGSPPPIEEPFAMMAPGPGDATPYIWPDDTIFPPAEDCTVPTLRINEIVALLHSSTDEEPWDRQNSTRDLPLTPADNVPSAPPLPDGEPVDDQTAAAINEVYYTYVACVNAGSVRQQYWLFSNDGIVRALAPNGRPRYYSIASLGVPPTPRPDDQLSPFRTFVELRLLPDGRVAALWEQAGQSGEAINYYLFIEINGQWYIDDHYCGTCG